MANAEHPDRSDRGSEEMSICDYDGVFCGFEPNFRVDGVLAEFAAILGAPFLCITMVDSSPMRSVLDHEIARPIAGLIPVWFAGRVLPVRLIPYLVGDTPLLTGFDEIYFLAGEGGNMPESAAYFTSERVAFNRRPPEEFLLRWRTSGSVGYLSDGCGLNFACADGSVARRFGAALGNCSGPTDCGTALPRK